MKILVIHRGRRDGYQVALALLKAHHDVKLVTSGYGTALIRALAKVIPLHRLKKLSQRRSIEMCDSLVYQSNAGDILATACGLLFGKAFASRMIHKSLTKRALRLIRQDEYDAIVCYSYASFGIFSDPSCFHLRKILFQCHPHPLFVRNIFLRAIESGLVPANIQEQELAYPLDYLAALIAEPLLADQVICASSFTQASLVAGGVDEDRITVIPYGISDKFELKRRDPVKPGKRELRILFVGQFVHRKGLGLVAQILNALDFSAHITFIGRGIRELDPSSGISNHFVRCSVLWDVPEITLIEQYANADVFLFPSLVEGFAQVILEGMRAGCVPVVSDSSCGHDVVRDGEDGYVISAVPEQVPAYVEALRRLSEHEHLNAMMRSSQARSLSFTWDRFREGVARAVEAERNSGNE